VAASPDPSPLALPQLEGYVVDRVPGFRATKAYVCPGCDAAIAPRVGHVVAWPEDLVDLRRHWHLHCWRIATRRGRV
jgi:hypothetical protein